MQQDTDQTLLLWSDTQRCVVLVLFLVIRSNVDKPMTLKYMAATFCMFAEYPALQYTLYLNGPMLNIDLVLLSSSNKLTHQTQCLACCKQQTTPTPCHDCLDNEEFQALLEVQQSQCACWHAKSSNFLCAP